MEKILFNAFTESDLRRVFKEVLDEMINSHAILKNTERKVNYLNRFEVVDLLKISLPTLGNWTKEGILQAYRIGKRVLYREDEVNSSLEKVRNLKYKRG